MPRRLATVGELRQPPSAAVAAAGNVVAALVAAEVAIAAAQSVVAAAAAAVAAAAASLMKRVLQSGCLRLKKRSFAYGESSSVAAAAAVVAVAAVVACLSRHPSLRAALDATNKACALKRSPRLPFRGPACWPHPHGDLEWRQKQCGGGGSWCWV